VVLQNDRSRFHFMQALNQNRPERIHFPNEETPTPNRRKPKNRQ